MSLPTTAASSTRSLPDNVKKSDLTLVVAPPHDVSGAAEPGSKKKGFRFWMVMLAICSSLFLSALELTAVSTALPTIVHDLHGDDFVWVSSAYSLASTALLPMSGGLAQAFGRRATMLLSIFLFALGSALCGAAQDMNWLVAARTVQGAGGGGLLSMSAIIISDLVPLRERAIYNGLIGMTWALAGAMGPLVGGALADHGQWRWLFYLNLPVAGVAAGLVIAFLTLRTPEGTLREKLGRMDWIGNAIVIASSTAVVLGLTWGGVRYAWSSAQVLVPLVLGLIGMVVFVAYEAKVATHPLVPPELLSNRTSVSGYIQTFICPLVVLASIYFVPIYLQACKAASPIRSGVLELPYAFAMGAVLVLTGATIAASKAYRPQLWVGWAAFVVSMGLLSTVHAQTPTAHIVGFTALLGFAAGVVYSATYFPVLAPLPVSQNAHALALFSFFRSFAGVWGVTIGTAVLQTQLGKRLPADFIAHFPGGVAIAYSAIPALPTLPEPLHSQVTAAFADSLVVVWQVMTGIAALGLLASLMMKGLPLHTQVDENWGIEEKARIAADKAPQIVLPVETV